MKRITSQVRKHNYNSNFSLKWPHFKDVCIIVKPASHWEVSFTVHKQPGMWRVTHLTSSRVIFLSRAPSICHSFGDHQTMKLIGKQQDFWGSGSFFQPLCCWWLIWPIQNNAKNLLKKLLKYWHMGTHLKVLSESYLMNTNMTGFRWFSKIFAYLYFGRK